METLINALTGVENGLAKIKTAASAMDQVLLTGLTRSIGMIARLLPSLLADMIDRRTILLIAAAVFLVFAIPYFYLVNTGSFLLATIAEIIGLALHSALVTAPFPPSTPRISRPAIAPRAQVPVTRSRKYMAAG